MFGELEKGQIIAACEAHLARKGILVEQIQDYQDVKSIVSNAQKEYLTPVVSPEHNDLMQSNSIWLVAWKDGVPAIIGGARLEDLGFEPVSSFWPRSLERLYQRPKGGLISGVNPRLDAILQGRLAYFGDLHVRPDCRNVIGHIQSFVTIGHMLVSLKWNPDFTYAFIHDRGMAKSASYRYGFNYSVPSALSWINPPHPRSDKEWCCLVSRGDLPHVCREVVKSLPARLVEKTETSARPIEAKERQMISEA